MDPNSLGKVGNKADSKVDNSGATGRVADNAQPQAGNRSPSPSDTVELTSRAQLLERLEKSLETLPTVDSQRVAEVKAAIENGNYEIDSGAIADAMIRFERSMGD